MQVKILISQNLVLGVKQRNHCFISELSTLESHEWKVRAVVKNPGEISCSLEISFADPGLADIYVYSTLVYSIPIPDILLRDVSSGSLFSKFLVLWNRLVYNNTVRCEMLDDFKAVINEISNHIEEVKCCEDIKAAFQGVTLQGDRIAIYLTGTLQSKNIRLEFRTNSVDLLKNFTSQTEVFYI